MKKKLILTVLVSMMAHAYNASALHNPDKSTTDLLSFIELNAGQSDMDYSHIARASGYTTLLRADQAHFLLSAGAQTALALPGELVDDLPQRFAAKRSDVRMQLLGANAAASGIASGVLTGHSNYLFGNDPDKWLKAVPHFATLQFPDVYPGIDVVYTLEGSALRYDFVLAPHANADAIRLHFDGAKDVRLNNDGDLVVRVGDIEMVHSAPKIFQKRDGAQHNVAGGFLVQDDGSLHFHVAAHDPDTTLVIDPQITLSTFLGGSGDDGAQDITIDGSNRMIVTGTTDSVSSFPGPLGSGTGAGGASDIFVARFAADGQSLEFVSFIGGAGDDNPHQVDVDGADNIFIAGFTSSPDFPTVQAFQPNFLGGGGFNSDGFVTKMDVSGGSLLYSTYLGGSGPVDPLFGFEWIRGLTVDTAGNAFVVGETSSPDFPANDVVGGRACLAGEGGGVSTFIGDAFLARFSPAGTLESAVCVGGSQRDTGRGIALAADGAIHITGFTRSSDNPTSAGAFQTDLAAPGTGAYDTHVTRFDPSGTLIDWSSLVGGSSTEFAQQIRVASDSSSIVVGTSFSTDFPTSPGAYQPNLAASDQDFIDDGIVYRLSAGGSTLAFGTYLGGSGRDTAWGLDLDENERIYVSAYTDSLDFPQVNATQANRGGASSVISTIGPSSDDSRAVAMGQIFDGSVRNLVVAANNGQDQLYILDENDSGATSMPIGLPTDSSTAAAFYSDELDPFADLFVVAVENGDSQAYLIDTTAGLSITPNVLSPSTGLARAVAVGPLLGTPDADIVIGNHLSANVIYAGEPGGFGTGALAMPGSATTATLSLAIGDLNFDGFADIVEGNDGLNLVYFGNGSGFDPGVPLGGENARSNAVAVGDMDGDGDFDVVVGNDGAPNRLYRNQGDGTFEFLQDIEFFPSTTTGLALADPNNDGALDIVTADANSGVVFINNGFGQFARLPLSSTVTPATDLYRDPTSERIYRATAAGAPISGLSVGLTEAYLAVLDFSGRELLFSTYVGGSGTDRSEWGLHVVDSGNVYLAGVTTTTDFPTVAPVQSQLAGDSDAFVTRFDMSDLEDLSPATVYQTLLTLAQPTFDGITQVLINWSTASCGATTGGGLYSYELLLLADGEIVYSDPVIRDGVLQPFRDLQRDEVTFGFSLEGLELNQINQGIDALIGSPAAFGTNYLVADTADLPVDGTITIIRYDDGEFVAGDDVVLASQSTTLIAGDCDVDGVDASVDNCLNVANADQRDSNGDNIGNACDADLNNDCIVNVIDLGVLRNVFFTSDEDADFNGDGIVNVSDLGILRLNFFTAPGPSGLANSCQ